MTTYRPTSTGAAIVAPGFRWLPIDDRTPRGCKLQLINRPAGVACYGNLGTREDFFTHWAPLPVFEDDPVLVARQARRLPDWALPALIIWLLLVAATFLVAYAS